MRYTYTATDIGCENEEDFLAVGFAGVPDNMGHPTASLLLMRSTDEEDIPGIKGVYIEWNDQINSEYGCIESAQLSRHSFFVRLTEDVHFILDLRKEDNNDNNRLTELLVEFNLNDEVFQELSSTLSDVIFYNCDCFVINR